MPLTSARPLAPSSASPPPAPAPWWSALTPEGQAAHPRWLVLLLVLATVSAFLPLAYRAVYGVDRIAAATIDAFQASTGTPPGSDARDAIYAYVRDQSPVLVVVGGFLAVGIASALAAALMNIGALLVGAEISAAQAFGISILGSLAVLGVQLFGLGIGIFLTGLDASAAVDWQHTAALNLGVFFPTHSPFLGTVLATADFAVLVGLAVSALGVRAAAPRAGVAAVVFASSGWVLMMLVLRLFLAALLGVPLT